MPTTSRVRGSLAVLVLSVAVLGLSGVLALAFTRSPAAAAVLAAGLGLAGLALRRPEVAIWAVLFLLYSNLPAVSVTFHGVPKPVAALFPLLLLIPLARELFVRRRAIVLTPAFLLLVILGGVQALSAVLSRDPSSSLTTVGTFVVEGLTLYALVTNVLRSREDLRGATWALVAAGVLMSVVPLYQQLTHTFHDNYGGLAQVDGIGFTTGEALEESGAEERQERLSGPIGEKNRYAQVMLVLVPLGLSCALVSRRRGARLFALGATGSILIGFALAFSRGGALGMVGLIAAMAALRVIDARKLVIVGAALALMFAAVPQYWKRLETIAGSLQVLDQESARTASDGAVRRRVTEMLAAGRVFLDHPVLGVGPGLFKQYAAEYGNKDALRRIEGARRAHSLYLEIAAESGAVGLLLFLAAIAVTLAGLAAARRECATSDPELADLATAYLLAMVAYLGTGLFLHLSYMRYFYLVLALGGAVAEVARARAASPRIASTGTSGSARLLHEGAG